MIRYALSCERDHAFEGWFRNSEAFDEQLAAGEIACAHCGSTSVRKALMAPAVSGTRDQGGAAQQQPEAQTQAEAQTLTSDPRAKALAETIRRLRRHVVENAEYVGGRFAEESRKIHYEEAERRDIYGEASAEDAKSLLDEGIEVYPLPLPPEERN